MTTTQYDSGMTSKIAVSLPDHLVEQAKHAVFEGRAASVSAYVAEALEARQSQESLRQILEDWNTELGPPTPEEYAVADAALDAASQVSR